MRDTGPLGGGVSPDPADPGINRVLAAAAKHSLAVNLLCSGRNDRRACNKRAALLLRLAAVK
jgi:hypothetical protein